MTKRPVEAAVFWPLRRITNFRSIYGRLPGTSYSKDYLQCSGSSREALDKVLGGGINPVPITYHWPGGVGQSGTWRPSAVAGDNRGQLAWTPSSNSPEPWQIGDPAVNPAKTIAGDPSRPTEADADAEHERIEAAGAGAWLLAVKLVGEDRVLHPRVYLEKPTPGLEARSLDVLPRPLRAAIRALPSTKGSGGWVARGPAGQRAPNIFRQIEEALSRGPNVLLTGPPGTGKTVALEDLLSLYSADHLFDPDLWDNAWEVTEGGRRAVSLVFHPSYAYENFVASLVPAPASGGGGGVSLKAQPGPLISMAHWCGSPDREGLIAIDELNRAPTAAVFGDTLVLLDGDKRTGGPEEGVTIIRAFPDEDMNVRPEYADAAGNTAVAERLGLPRTLAIVAALNSSDRSVAPLDAALRRRFDVIEVLPDPAILAKHLGSVVPDLTAPFGPPAQWTEDSVRELALRVLMVLNERITQLVGSDFTLGHALLWGVKGEDVGSMASSLVAAFEGRILATLRATFVDQEDALAAVLNIGPGHPGTLGSWREATGSMANVAPRRLVLRRFAEMADYQQRLSAIATVL